MKKKVLSVLLAVTMVSTPVYGAEFSSEEDEQQVQETSIESSLEDADMDNDFSENANIETTEEATENADIESAEEGSENVDIESVEEDSEKESIQDSDDIEDTDIAEELLEEDIEEDTDDTISETEDIDEEILEDDGSVAEGFAYDSEDAAKEKKVSKVEIVKLPAQTSFVFPLSEYDTEDEEGLVDLYGLTLKVTYKDGKTEKIVLDKKGTDEFGDEFENNWHFREYEYEDGTSINGYKITIEHKKDAFDADRQMLRPGKYTIVVVCENNKKISCKYENAITIKMEDCLSLVKKGNKYSQTIKWNSKVNEYVKFIPQETGKYALSAVSDRSGTFPLENVYDNTMHDIKTEKLNGLSICELKKGATYYLHFDMSYYNSMTVKAEKFNTIKSIKMVGNLKPETLYAGLDISERSYNGKWDVSYCWPGKVKITYSDGYTETISMLDRNRYGQLFKCYIASKSKPNTGTYNVHVTFEKSQAECIVKNVPVKKQTEMPIINGQGSKTVFQRTLQKGLYVRLKTGTATQYKVNLNLPFKYDYLGGYTDMSIHKEGTKSISLNNGDICSLAPNTTYVISSYLGGYWDDAPTGTFVVTPIGNTKLSKCTIKLNSAYAYTGKAVTPSVTVMDKKVTLKKNRDYTVSYTNNKELGTATVTIKGKGSYTGTVKKTFKIVLKKTAITSAKKSGNTAIKLNWSKVNGASGYEVFKETGKSWKKIATVKTTNYTNTKLKTGTTYKYKIRSYKTVKGKKVYSDFSSVKSIKR